MVRTVYGVSDEVMAQVIPGLKEDPARGFGPYYVGATVDAFFLGVLTYQVSAYFSSYPNDSKWKKTLVLVCVFLSIFKGVQSFWAVWDRNIVWFGDYERVAAVHWALYTPPVSMVLLTAAAQSYFTWRCFNLTGRNRILLLFLVASILAMIGLGISISIRLAVDPLYAPALLSRGIPLLILGLVVDVTITSIVLHTLIKSRRGIKKSADAFLSNWIVITCQSALPPALSQAVNILVFSLSIDRSGWSGFCNMLTPRLYVFSLMYTLNSRNGSLGASLDTYDGTTAADGTPATGAKRRGFERNDAATLSAFQARPLTFAIETSGSCTSQSMPSMHAKTAVES